MKANILILLLVALLGLACQSESEGQPGTPRASFTQDSTTGVPGVTVQFTDTSSGEITSHLWDFGPLGSSSECS